MKGLGRLAGYDGSVDFATAVALGVPQRGHFASSLYNQHPQFAHGKPLSRVAPLPAVFFASHAAVCDGEAAPLAELPSL
jgi:hypothetical protein